MSLFRDTQGCGCGPSGYISTLDKRFLVPSQNQEANFVGAMANLGPRFSFSGHPGYTAGPMINSVGSISPIRGGTVAGSFSQSFTPVNIFSTLAIAGGALMAAGAWGKQIPYSRMIGLALMAGGFFAPSMFPSATELAAAQIIKSTAQTTAKAAAQATDKVADALSKW